MKGQTKQPFGGRKLVIATMHGKEKVIAPLLEEGLGVVTCLPPRSFNSDRFGTFTGEIKRVGNQLEAARKKAHEAMEMAGCDLAVSSEGSFGPDPSLPFVQSNLELVLFIDRKNGYEVRGHHRTQSTTAFSESVSTVVEVLQLADKLHFPEQGLIVRAHEKSKEIYKDITTIEELERLTRRLLRWPWRKSVYLETDLRAHRNPARMLAIRQATEDLVKNIASTCPTCEAPGFVITKLETGVPCSMCGLPTDLPMYEVYSCSECSFSEERLISKQEVADPLYCGDCNP